MGLRVTFISGLRRCGKSRVIQCMLDHLWKFQPHYLRLTAAASAKVPTRPVPTDDFKGQVASAQWLPYTPQRIFETLAEALTQIHQMDRYGSVIIEANADADLRHAYPYDHRIFIMPRPASLHEVFRDASRAAQELRRVLDDTQIFAREIFGLSIDRDDGEPSEPRPELSAVQMRSFLNSPLGDELATRIQLQQAYHGLVESDVILVNAQAGKCTDQSDDCLRRIRRLLMRLRSGRTRPAELFICDPTNLEDSSCRELMQALQPMCQRGH